MNERSIQGLRYEMALDLPAVHRGVRLARNVVRRFARLWGFKDTDVESLVLVVSELLANTIDHTSAEAAMTELDLEVEVRMALRLEVRGNTWTLHVTDQGGGDADEIRALIEPEGFPDLEDERGRGFFLLGQMVDKLEVQPNDNGSGLTFIATKQHES